MVETLISWGATHCFGVVGDGINSIIEALRKRQDRIMVYWRTPRGSGGLHGVGLCQTYRPARGLHRHHRPRRGSPSQRSLRRKYGRVAGCRDYRARHFRDLIGTRYQQGIDTTKGDAGRRALYIVEVTGPEHGGAGDEPRPPRGARRSWGRSSDRSRRTLQMMRLVADKAPWAIPEREPRPRGCPRSISPRPTSCAPPPRC